MWKEDCRKGGCFGQGLQLETLSQSLMRARWVCSYLLTVKFRVMRHLQSLHRKV